MINQGRIFIRQKMTKKPRKGGREGSWATQSVVKKKEPKITVISKIRIPITASKLITNIEHPIAAIKQYLFLLREPISIIPKLNKINNINI
jgi:hypothetical protein